MLSKLSTPTALALFASFTGYASAAQIIPCSAGAGTDNGCGGCAHDKAVDVAAWSSATHVDNFDLPDAAAKEGGGYDVWWVSKEIVRSSCKQVF